MIDPKVPEGWKTESFGPNCTVLSNAHGGVTVDWVRRGFRSGWSQSGPFASTSRYAGRGWKERLVADAIAWLEGVWRKRENDAVGGPNSRNHVRKDGDPRP